MAQLYPFALASKRNHLSMVGCCLGSELHELGMRMVCDFFDFEGWDTYFLGAITPSDALIETVRKHCPHLLCLSSTMTFGVPQTREVITTLRQSLGDDTPKIMVGGLAFLLAPSLALAVGADATAANAREAVHNASKLIGHIQGEDF